MSIHAVLSRWGVLAASSLALLTALSAGSSRAQEKIHAPTDVTPCDPGDSRPWSVCYLSATPDVTAVVSLKVADAWKSKPAALLRRVPGLGDMVHHLPGVIGLTPSVIRRATALQYHNDLLFHLNLNRPVSKTRLLQCVGPHAKQRKISEHGTLYVNEENWFGVLVIDECEILIGKAHEVESLYLTKKAVDRCQLLDNMQAYDLVIWINPQLLARARKSPSQSPDEGFTPFDLGSRRFRPLNRADEVTVAINFKPTEMTVESALHFANERLAKQAEHLIHPLRKEIEDAFLSFRFEDDENANPLNRALERFARACTVALHTMKVERSGSNVCTRMSVQCRETLLGAAFLLLNGGGMNPYCVHPTPEAHNARLAKLGVAMLEHHRKTGRLPAHAIDGTDGKPLLSWRVALLPYLGEKELYKQFHLDEPWDSDHNRQLIARMPDVFRTIEGDDTAPTTGFQVFWGKDTVFSGTKGKRLSDLKDGPEQTILVVEACRRVPWTKPEDVHVRTDESLPRFCQHPLSVVLADGRVALLPGFLRGSALNEKHLRALITRNGADKAEAQYALTHAGISDSQGVAPPSQVLPASYPTMEGPYVPMPVMPPQMLPPPAMPMPGPSIPQMGANVGGAIFGPPGPLPGMMYSPPGAGIPTPPQFVSPGLMMATPVAPSSSANQTPTSVPGGVNSNVAIPVTTHPSAHDDQPR